MTRAPMPYVVEMGDDEHGWRPIARFAAEGDAFVFYAHRIDADRRARHQWRCHRVRRGQRIAWRSFPATWPRITGGAS